MDGTTEAATSPDTEPAMTNGELYQRFKAVVDKLEAGATKTMLVHYLANEAVSRGWYLYQSRAGIDQEEARLLEAVKSWKKEARSVNRLKRVDTVLRKLDENREAEAAGRRPPHKFKEPRRRKAKRRAKL